MDDFIESAPRTITVDGMRVECFRSTIPMTHKTANGDLKVAAGDWVLTSGTKVKVMSHFEFTALHGIQALAAGFPPDIVGRPVNFGTDSDPRNVNL